MYIVIMICVLGQPCNLDTAKSIKAQEVEHSTICSTSGAGVAAPYIIEGQELRIICGHDKVQVMKLMQDDGSGELPPHYQR